MFFKSNLEKAKERKTEEYFFNIIAQELEKNIKHNPTWAKAISKSKGDTERAKSLYIEYRLESLKDDSILQREREIESQKEAKKELKETFYKKQLEQEELWKKENTNKFHPLITFILFSIIIIFLFKLLLT